MATFNSNQLPQALKFAVDYGWVSEDDAKLLSELSRHSANLDASIDQYATSFANLRRQLQLSLQKNRYFQYQNGGPKPLTYTGAPDWDVKDAYLRIEASIAALNDLEDRTLVRLSNLDQSVDKLFAFLRLALYLPSISRELERRAADSMRTLSFEISLADEQLCLVWAGRSANELDGTSPLSKLIGTTEAGRLLSARAAEIAVADYYRALGHQVTDVSILQLEGSDARWKDFDLVVGNRAIDVKNARRSFSSPNSFVEHCVPQFKNVRGTGAEVSIVGVLSDYLQPHQIVDSPVNCRVLGELRISDLRRLYVWVRNRFGDVVNFDGLWKPDYQPGWAFEYPVEHYPGRQIAVDMIGKVTSQFLEYGIHSDHIPSWLLPLCTDHDLVRKISLSVEKRRIVDDLRSLAENVALSRPAVFVYVMGVILESLAREVSVKDVEVPLKALLFIPELKDSASHPLGLDDSQEYVAGLLEALLKVYDETLRENVHFVAFKLTHPSILRGQTQDGAWMTLLAYCGGWIRRPVTAKCGSSPLVFGEHSVCRSCGHLVCNRCGFCSKDCDLVEERQHRTMGESTTDSDDYQS
jgi:hypothetical protein